MEFEEALGIVLALPDVEQRPSVDDAFAFRVRGKGFCYLNEGRRRALLKATFDEREALVAAEPAVFQAAWAAGRFGWCYVQLALVDPGEFAELVTEAWRLTAPRRLVAALG